MKALAMRTWSLCLGDAPQTTPKETHGIGIVIVIVIILIIVMVIVIVIIIVIVIVVLWILRGWIESCRGCTA